MKIFTHGHNAHADEMIACALLTTQQTTDIDEIIRVKDEKELPSARGNEDYFIVDIGNVYDGIWQFDHHQDDLAVNGKCAATLIADTFMPFSNNPLVGSFLERIELQDTRGIAAVEQKYGWNGYASRLQLEWLLVRHFEREPLRVAKLLGEFFENAVLESLEEDDLSALLSFALARASRGNSKVLEEILRKSGWACTLDAIFSDNFELSDRDGFLTLELFWAWVSRCKPQAAGILIEEFRAIETFYNKVEHARKWVKENSEIRTIEDCRVLYLTKDPRSDGVDPTVCNKAQDGILHDNSIAVVVGFDPRDEEGESRTLFRTRTHGSRIGMDFTRSSAKNTRFCHKAGFLLNFVPADEDEWKRLVSQSLRN